MYIYIYMRMCTHTYINKYIQARCDQSTKTIRSQKHSAKEFSISAVAARYWYIGLIYIYIYIYIYGDVSTAAQVASESSHTS